MFNSRCWPITPSMHVVLSSIPLRSISHEMIVLGDYLRFTVPTARSNFSVCSMCTRRSFIPDTVKFILDIYFIGSLAAYSRVASGTSSVNNSDYDSSTLREWVVSHQHSPRASSYSLCCSSLNYSHHSYPCSHSCCPFGRNSCWCSW